MSNCTTPVTHEDHNSRRGFPRRRRSVRLHGSAVVLPAPRRPCSTRSFAVCLGGRSSATACQIYVPAPSPRPDLADGAVAVHELVLGGMPMKTTLNRGATPTGGLERDCRTISKFKSTARAIWSTPHSWRLRP